MTTKHISLAEADGHLAELVEAAQRGYEIVIEDAGKAPVKLVRVSPTPKTRTLGVYRGKIRVHEDFNDPLPESFLLSASE